MKDLIDRTSLGLAEILTPGRESLEKIGTGFAVSSDGKLVTCRHVVNGLDECYAQLWGEERAAPRPAKILAQDANHDIAILSVDHSLPQLTLGNFEQVSLGDDVLWGGFPFWVWVPSFHRGMISLKGDLPLPYTTALTEGLQLDGTVNSGNSGGPVVDPRDGRVVAILSSGMGRIDEELRLLVEPQLPDGMSMEISMAGVDPLAALKRIVAEMDRYLQLGVGYGISVRYVSALLARI